MRIAAVTGMLVVGVLACQAKSPDKAAKPASKQLRVKDIDVPSVGAAAVDALPDETVMVSVSRTEILVEGDSIVALTDGVVPPADKTQGTRGIEITPLKVVLQKHAARFDKVRRSSGEGSTGQRQLTLVADRTTRYGLLTSVIYSAGQADYTVFDILVTKADGELGMVRLTLPRPANQVNPPTVVVVTIAPGKLTLFATGDGEGGFDKPLVTQAAKSEQGLDFDVAPLAAAAAALAARHPSKEPRAIVLLADQAAPLQTVVDVTVAVRAAADGTPLFPDVHLATGIQ